MIDFDALIGPDPHCRFCGREIRAMFEYSFCGSCMECAKKKLDENAALHARIAELETENKVAGKALELACELQAQSGGCPDDKDCETDCARDRCWCDYFIQKARTELVKEVTHESD